MPLGDSDELRSGDDVTVLGFPGISESVRISVTTGVISTFVDRDDLGERSEIDTDARIAPGNSGGAAVNNDAELIGIPTALFAPRRLAGGEWPDPADQLRARPDRGRRAGQLSGAVGSPPWGSSSRRRGLGCAGR